MLWILKLRVCWCLISSLLLIVAMLVGGGCLCFEFADTLLNLIVVGLLQPENSKVLNQPLLHLLETIMIIIELPASPCERLRAKPIVGQSLPGNFRQNLQPIP